MGLIASKVSRKINRFNVESRAHRVLERDKPTAAPKFESNLRDLQRALDLDPDLVDKLNKKDTHLDDRLKNVYVTSEDRYIDYGEKGKDNPSRTMPLNRSAVEDFEFGFQEPTRVAPGRCTLRQAMKFITDHQGNPELWTQRKIADDYKIKEEIVEKILLYFKSFQIFIPSTGTGKDNYLTQAKTKQINSGDEK